MRHVLRDARGGCQKPKAFFPRERDDAWDAAARKHVRSLFDKNVPKALAFVRAHPDVSLDLGAFLVSKYAIPAVVFVQYWAQLRYPSPRNLALRKALLALYGAAAIAMAFQSACTDVIRARWPRAHDTLRWGGYDGAAAPTAWRQA